MAGHDATTPTTKKQENDLKEYSNENELLLQQLHLTQEEFERAHLNHKQTEAQLNSTLQDKNKLATEYQQKTTETHQKSTGSNKKNSNC